MNYDLKINNHVNMIANLPTLFQGSINELHIGVEDKEDTDLLARFEEIYSYLFKVYIGFIFQCLSNVTF